jgi:predicted tellurium resistance membrane protein TerC
VGGSQLILKLMDRFPKIILFGAMLLGWIAGTMAQSDPAVIGWVPQTPVWHYSFGIVGALVVYVLGSMLKRRSPAVG